MLWWGWWRAEPEVATERGHVVQSLRCRHFIHEWNWQSAAAPAFPHLFPTRRWNGFLNVSYGGVTPGRLFPSRAAAWAQARPLCCVCQRSAVLSNRWFDRKNPQKKLIAAVMTIKQIIICLMFLSVCSENVSRLFKMSNFNAGQEDFKCLDLLFPSYLIFFLFSLYSITTNSHARPSASPQRHINHTNGSKNNSNKKDPDTSSLYMYLSSV